MLSLPAFYQLINKALEFIGVQQACETLLTDLEEGLSSDRFDRLKAQVYDVGTVVEETQEGSGGQDHLNCFPLSNYDKVFVIPLQFFMLLIIIKQSFFVLFC